MFSSIPFQRSFFYALLFSPSILLSNTCLWSVLRHLVPSLDDGLTHINHQARRQGNSLLAWNLNIATSTIYSLIDVTAQGVLVRGKPQKNKNLLDFPLIILTQIYRCWVVWNRKLAVVVVPSILALISLGKSS